MVFILSQGFSIHYRSWPEWDWNSRPCACHANALTTELLGRAMKCA